MEKKLWIYECFQVFIFSTLHVAVDDDDDDVEEK